MNPLGRRSARLFYSNITIPKIDLSLVEARSDWALLEKVTPSDLAEAVEDLARSCEHAGTVDFDLLMKVGLKLQLTRAVGLDTRLVRWLESGPTAKRLDIVCALLNGLWLKIDENYRRIDADLLGRLIAAKAAADTSPDAEYSCALVMRKVLTDPTVSPDALELAIRTLSAIMETGTGDKVLDAQLRSWGTVDLASAKVRLNID